MKMKLWSVILLPAFLAAGCVGTVSEKKTAAVPFVKDKIEGRYERTVPQVYEAALHVVKLNGTLQNEMILHKQEIPARAIEARVNQRKVWIRVEPVDAKVTSVVVQARTSGGGTDMRLAYELEKQIALQLVNK
ncbi:MAG: DUF3568 family protein [Verrucomicrobia bacterium]|jgi:hypothetical protein|nr:DUF3568 family protein [Verrucomicrobiota bacterium]